MPQGAVLTTSDRGGIRIQYSKNPFGKKRDANGNWINTHDSPAPYAPYSPRSGPPCQSACTLLLIIIYDAKLAFQVCASWHCQWTIHALNVTMAGFQT